MKKKSLAEKLIYLDSDFVSRMYETEFDVSPTTSITRTHGIQASASLPLFSGGGSSSESKSYSVSTLEMLDKLSKRLEKYPSFDNSSYTMDSSSGYFWVDGVFFTSKVSLSRTTHTITLIGRPDPKKPRRTEEFIGEEAFFAIKSGETQFALSPTDEYFVPGISALKGLSHLVINRLSMPCRALLRVFSANTSFHEWVAIPLVIYDPDGK
ncbi:hypothetical protein [Dyella sp.]|jgi:hypothetical protein|uniref:hypothetical protein n=1 Tax=Dyella sp. TaxID=1869338 RepID=UPI002D76B873|nr:hypothetical protein [Dyella sp.]HET6433345.1 hypothetical protein [Dyella sp.]